ncbi:hypothetical protein GF352_01600 [archaeon]|nr:hypothetical protein [archaeon]
MVEVLEKVIKELPDCLVEAAITREELESVKVENNKVSGIDSGESIKLEVRVTKGLRSAYAWTNNLNKWRECTHRAKKLMKASSKLKTKPLVNTKTRSNKSYTHPGINKEIIFLKEKAEEVIKSANELRVNVSESIINKSLAKGCFLNSNNTSYKQEQSSVRLELEMSSGDSSAWDLKTSQGPSLNYQGIARRNAQLCLDSMKAGRLKTGLFDVVFDYRAMTNLLKILTPSLLANNVIEDKSYLQGRVGEKVISPLLSIKDVGALPDGVHNQLMDAEGTKVKNKYLFNKGVLKQFLNDLYTASRMNKEPTGNSAGLMMRGLVSNNYLVIEPGDADKEEMLNDCLYVNSLMGTHTANTVSGDFALNALNTFQYKDGERKPLRDLMISGNIFQLFKNAVMISKESRFEDEVKTPLIRFKDVQVVG